MWMMTDMKCQAIFSLIFFFEVSYAVVVISNSRINPYPAVHDNPYFANSVDPDLKKKPSDQDLHCLSFSLWM